MLPHVPHVSLTSLDSSAVLHFWGVRDDGIGREDTRFHEKAATYVETPFLAPRRLLPLDLYPAGGAILHQTINRLPLVLLALGRRVNQRRIPTRRGRLSPPMATAPRRWAPRPTRHAHLPSS